jgi:phosphopantothenoylcysteine decarboxylase/phosphopantothenate--cysteine ligase
MNTNMWEHEAVQRNLQVLEARGVGIVEPGEGFLACGWTGKGRLAEPQDIVAAADRIVRPAQTLAGRHVLVTAGPTYEDIDPVRYFGNRSSGRMGYAVAAEAARRGAAVTLVSGPTTIDAPGGVDLVRIRTAMEMRDEVVSRAAGADIVVMAAAVADYAPEKATEKIAKDSDELVVRLARTPDILSELGTRRAAGEIKTGVLVGFAAETSHVVARAREKRLRKQVDLIVANDVSQTDRGFDVDQNAVTLVTARGEQEVSLRSKTEVARAILDRVELMMAIAPGSARAGVQGGE